MDNTCDIQYIYDETTNMELILCNCSNFSYPLHNHVSVFTIGMILKGSITLTTPEHITNYRANQVFTIFPYLPHSIHAQEDYTLLTICIDKHLIDSQNLSSIKSNMKSLLSKVPDSQTLNQEQTDKLLSCLDSFSYPIPVKRNYFIENIKKQVEQFPEKKYNLDDMSKAAFTSKYHFVRKFKQEVGLTPHQFQLQNRIRKAKHLLNQTDTITKVAMTTGFCDQSHFIKQFEKIVRISPTAYQKSYRRIGFMQEKIWQTDTTR